MVVGMLADAGQVLVEEVVVDRRPYFNASLTATRDVVLQPFARPVVDAPAGRRHVHVMRRVGIQAGPQRHLAGGLGDGALMPAGQHREAEQPFQAVAG
jgi:hypothetical protein